MHPETFVRIAKERQQDLLRQAAEYRLVRSFAPRSASHGIVALALGWVYAMLVRWRPGPPAADVGCCPNRAPHVNPGCGKGSGF